MEERARIERRGEDLFLTERSRFSPYDNSSWVLSGNTEELITPRGVSLMSYTLVPLKSDAAVSLLILEPLLTFVKDVVVFPRDRDVYTLSAVVNDGRYGNVSLLDAEKVVSLDSIDPLFEMFLKKRIGFLNIAPIVEGRKSGFTSSTTLYHVFPEGLEPTSERFLLSDGSWGEDDRLTNHTFAFGIEWVRNGWWPFEIEFPINNYQPEIILEALKSIRPLNYRT